MHRACARSVHVRAHVPARAAGMRAPRSVAPPCIAMRVHAARLRRRAGWAHASCERARVPFAPAHR
eukprot:4711456-Pleurochrysis_carterae.AAC.1